MTPGEKASASSAFVWSLEQYIVLAPTVDDEIRQKDSYISLVPFLSFTPSAKTSDAKGGYGMGLQYCFRMPRSAGSPQG